MKRRWIAALCALLLALTCGLCACRKDEETFTPKPVDGIPLAFDDGTSYYAWAPSAVVEGDKMYMFYNSNKTAGQNDASVALRVGTASANGWEFGERTVVLEASESGWDAGGVSDADVVKGTFSYQGTQYSWLMAYQGRPDRAETEHQIGFALANAPEGPWVKTGDPVIGYDSAVTGYAWGVGQPSLISYDRGGKVYLSYTRGEALFTGQFLAELDCSDCAAVKGADAAFMLPEAGLRDGGSGQLMFNNAGFAARGNDWYVARDFNPVASAAPSVATAVQVAHIAQADVYTAGGSWTVDEERINFLDLAAENNNGWERVYAASIVKDAYGQAYGDGITVAASVTSYDPSTREYLFFQGIVLYTLGA